MISSTVARSKKLLNVPHRTYVYSGAQIVPSVFDKTTARVLVTGLLFAAALAVLYLARKTFIVFLFAIFFAHVLEPIVTRAERIVKGPRVRAIVVTYALLGIIVAVFLTTVGPKIAGEGQMLTRSVPNLVENFGTGKFIVTFGARRGWSYETQMRVQQFLIGHREQVIAGAQGFARRAAQVAANASLHKRLMIAFASAIRIWASVVPICVPESALTCSMNACNWAIAAVLFCRSADALAASTIARKLRMTPVGVPGFGSELISISRLSNRKLGEAIPKTNGEKLDTWPQIVWVLVSGEPGRVTSTQPSWLS